MATAGRGLIRILEELGGRWYFSVVALFRVKSHGQTPSADVGGRGEDGLARQQGVGVVWVQMHVRPHPGPSSNPEMWSLPKLASRQP